MNSGAINLDTSRAAEARLAKRVGKAGYTTITMAGVALAAAGILFILLQSKQLGLLLFSPAALCLAFASWWKHELSVLPVRGNGINDRLSGDVLVRIKRGPQDPQNLFNQLKDHWHAGFLLNHLLLTPDMVSGCLSTDEAATAVGLAEATRLADQQGSQTIELGHVVAGLMLTAAPLQELMTRLKAQPTDIQAMANWFARGLTEGDRNKTTYGGIGRDWAFGYTPLLDRFGQNISRGIMNHGAPFGWLTNSVGVQAVETAFNNGSSAVVLVGQEGIGKTTSVFALAQRLIEGNTSPELAYHQIVIINAIDVTSNARQPRDLEQIMLSLTNEARHAGNIILFLDNAQMFFDDSPGAFDGTHILQSIVEARAVPMILALTPADLQRLKSRSQSLAGMLTPVLLQELPEEGVMHVLEDTAIGLENRHKLLVSYEALHEAYRLSGRYEQEEAYPGKAIKLLGQAVNHAEHGAVTAISVQQAIEQTRGVKATSAAPAEADALLNLEDKIHERMINQTQAVKAIASSLRRARAGVTNPNRPIGSFLFLGPTGVGKTELAKAVAATYFGDEKNMVRLDMSEYQQPDDIQRLLDTGENSSSSLLLSVRQQPFAVVLLDEIEKAHPNILNLLLQLLDEGQLTDSSGRSASFRDCIVIATSNAGAQTIRDRVGEGQSLESFTDQLTDELITSGQFKPELLNRFDEMVLFRPLTPDELAQVVRLMLNGVNQTLATQNITVDLTDAAIQKIVAEGNDPRLGARPMRRMLQRAVEDIVAQKILRNEARPGDRVLLDAADLSM
jgi:ATP-dependent Clp protease ATP-binding subunit ClpC